MVDNISNKNSILLGMFWSLMSRFGTLGFALISNIILARLLSPSDFGCIGMIMVFVSLANTFLDGGLGAALIQKKNCSDLDYHTVFTFNLIFSIFLYLILYVSSYYIADFYRIPVLSDILKVEGLILIINGFRIVQYNKLLKELKFKEIALYELFATFCGSTLGITLAFCGGNVWSLVFNNICYSLIFTILLYIKNKEDKVKLNFNYKRFRSLISFGSAILLSNLVDTIYKNINSLIIGKTFNSTQLGYYNQAEKLESIPVLGVTQAINSVFFPMFSKIQDDKNRVGLLLMKSINVLTFLLFPIMTIFIFIASPLINLLFSDKWNESVLLLQILCFNGMILPINMLHLNVLRSFGKGSKYLFMQLFQFSIGLICILIGLNWGITGLLYGIIMASMLYYICISFINSSIIDVSLTKQIRCILGNLSLTFLTAFIVYVTKDFVVIDNFFIKIIIPTLEFLFVYLLLSFCLKLDGFRSCRQIFLKK